MPAALASTLSLPAAADTKLDPDPKLLPKARTLATAKVDENFDLPGAKVPFPIRFGICVVQLSAIRDDGRAWPAPRELPGAATGWHRHGWPYFVVLLTDATMKIERNGRVSEARFKAGDSYQRPAGVEHDVPNAADKPLAFVEIEVKRPDALVQLAQPQD